MNEGHTLKTVESFNEIKESSRVYLMIVIMQTYLRRHPHHHQDDP